MFKNIKKGIVALGLMTAVGTTNAMAAVDVSGITLDVKSVEDIAVVMLGALAIIWVAKRVIQFLR